MTGTEQRQADDLRRTTADGAAVYLLFALTGVGLVLPGTLLPLLVRQWSWNDAASGNLFFVFFLGTSLGAFCARGTLGRMLGLATALFALPVMLLDRLRGGAVFGAIALYGFGLGLAMTAVSLLQSRRHANDRLRELTRLNLLWALGACLGPPVLLRTSALTGLSTTLRWTGAIMLLSGTLVSWRVWREPVPPSGSWQAWRHVRQLPPVYAVALPLSTGIEAGVGGWLTTYTMREHHAGETVVGAVTALWAGLLLSRLLFSGRRLSLSQRAWLSSAFAWLLVVGIAVLLLVNDAAGAVGGALCVGFGVGPLYPYLLSRLLDRGEAGNAGFLAAGAGSALLPLCIGLVAQRGHSLALGLLVPLLGSVMLAAAMMRESGPGHRLPSPARRWE